MATRDPALDPRLGDLVDKLTEPGLLDDDLDAGRVRVQSVEHEKVLTVRVLVKVSGAPPHVPGSTWIPLAAGIHAVEVPVAELRRLAAHPTVDYVEASQPYAPQLDTALGETGVDLLHQPAAPRPALTGKGVVVGVIDSGMDYTLDDFRDADGRSRVAFLWDQTEEPAAGEHAASPWGLGVEYDAAALDLALKHDDPFNVAHHQPEPSSHGTHVAGIAAGNGRSADAQFPAGKFVGAAPEATIVFVQPQPARAGSFTDSWTVAAAVSYIYAKADELDLPCVINMSLSRNGGSHDGASLVERVIDSLVEAQSGRAFVHAAGNGHVWDNHASGTLAAGATRTLSWQVGGGLELPGGAVPAAPDPSLNELELWYSSNDSFHVRLISPTGASTVAFAPGDRDFHTFADGTTALVDSEQFSALNGDARVFIRVERGTAPAVTSGKWQVEITAAEIREGRFDAYIERDARERGVQHMQSFFPTPDFDGEQTLGTPATSRTGIAVANYDHRTTMIQDASSRGRTRDGRAKPDVAAPGVRIMSACSMGGRPTEAGAVHPMRVPKTGTSMSAPHVAGIIALLLQRRPGLTSEQIRSILVASARQVDGVAVFDQAWGHGRVDAVEAVRLLG
ncbi:Subtilase family protein [Actinokineospora alba]|uniref:Subtilase family protein n=1 Tax=Actinokineospora alba TaxID=504798 RepID=A0A1H0QNY7_9PSEU|nr:S8 family peptidase [Actinokineospora alba]TDP70460.1 subtilase family protein [Actinokineospora alba]SDI31119.1 Subtilase family protein [Actinokineospora alba]SDP19093.1 Subtilase family protein [Actinokineospora alba]